jgi:hypothetical protein
MTIGTRTRQLTLIAGLLIAVLLLAGCAEDGLYSATFITSGDHTVATGEQLTGDVFLLDGRLVIAPDAEVRRHLFVMGGEVEVAGRIGGDLSVLGGEVRLVDGARVAGDLSDSTGAVQIASGASVAGDVREGSGVEVPFSAEWLADSWWNRIGWAVATTVIVGLTAGLLGLLLPRPVARIGRAIVEQPLPSGALGFLLLLVMVVLIVFMAFTVVLLPVSMLLLVIFGLGFVLYGVVGAGYAFGGLLARWRGWRLDPPAQGLLGGASLTLLVNVSQVLPVVGWIVPGVVLSLAVGAVTLTRFGARVFEPETADLDRPGEEPSPLTG